MRIHLLGVLALLVLTACNSGGTNTSAESDSQLTLIYFDATWCAPCQGMKSTLPEVLNNQPEFFTVQQVDVDQEPLLAQHHDIDTIPALILLDEKGERGRMVGQASMARLDRFFQQALLH